MNVRHRLSALLDRLCEYFQRLASVGEDDGRACLRRAVSIARALPAPQRRELAQPAVVTENGAGGGHGLDARWRRLRKTDLLQRIERRGMDARHLCFGQRRVLAAGETGPHRAKIVRQRGRALRHARRAAARAAPPP